MRVFAPLILLLAAWLLPAPAQAACNSSNQCNTYAEAFAACSAALSNPAWNGTNGDWRYETICRDHPTYPTEMVVAFRKAFFKENFVDSNYPSSWSYVGGKVCPPGQLPKPGGGCRADCTKVSPTTGNFTPPNGSVACATNECEVAYFYNGDGTSTAMATGATCNKPDEQQKCALTEGYYWHPTLHVCAPEELEDCEPGQDGKEGICKKKDECPTGMQTNEAGLCVKKDTQCPAGKVDGPDGSCVDKNNTCGAGKALKKDGTCGKDANSDGKADDEDDDPNNDSEKNEFSGGDDCNTPPACSGDPIMCGQARIQWRIECNTRRAVNVKGGGCNDPPICTGDKCDAMEYSQLIQQWRTACAVEKLKVTGGGTSDGDANKNGVPDVMEGGVAEEGGAQPGVDTVNAGAMWSKVDQQGWLGGGSCPGLPQFQFMGKSYNLGTKPCEQVALLGQLMMLAAMAGAAYIIGRAAAGV